MKTIGILGGFGPQATMDFEQRVHRAAQQLLPPQRNSGYPPMVVHYCRHPPVLLDADGNTRMPIQLDPRLLKAAHSLGQLADFLVVISNGLHKLQPALEQAADRPILSTQPRSWPRQLCGTLLARQSKSSLFDGRRKTENEGRNDVVFRPSSSVELGTNI